MREAMPVFTAQATMDFSGTVWRKSSRSSNAGSNGACVEVASTESAVAVRDSKNRDGVVLVFPANQWSGFLTALR